MIITLTGENDSSRIEVQRQLIEEFIVNHGDMGVEHIDGEEASYERMYEAAQSLPFLTPRKLLVLYKPSANKEFLERYETFLVDVAETNDMVIIEPKLDKRLSYFKRLKKDTQFQEFKLLEGSALVQFIAQYAKQQGATLNSENARLLIERVGTNQLVLQHEIDKLAAYSLTISNVTIDLLTERTPASSIFELLDAAFAGNTTRAVALYKEQRAMQVEPQQIIAMIVWQLHIVAILSIAGERTSDEVAAQAKLSPFIVRKSQSLARKVGSSRVRQLVTSLREFDIRLKSESISADEVVQYYLLSIAV